MQQGSETADKAVCSHYLPTLWALLDRLFTALWEILIPVFARPINSGLKRDSVQDLGVKRERGTLVFESWNALAASWNETISTNSSRTIYRLQALKISH